MSILMNECVGLDLKFAQSIITSQFSTHLSCLVFLSLLNYCHLIFIKIYFMLFIS